MTSISLLRGQVPVAEAGTETLFSDWPPQKGFQSPEPEDLANDQGQDNDAQIEPQKTEAVGLSLVLFPLLAAGIPWAWIFMWFVILLDQGLSILLRNVFWQHP